MLPESQLKRLLFSFLKIRWTLSIKKRRDFVVAVMLTDKKGDFSIDKLPVLTTYQLLITAIGYKSFNEKVAFNLKIDRRRYEPDVKCC